MSEPTVINASQMEAIVQIIKGIEAVDNACESVVVQSPITIIDTDGEYPLGKIVVGGAGLWVFEPEVGQ